MTTHTIKSNLLYVTVNSCYKLRDTQWISRKDPYVSVEYGGKKFQTRTCTDGGKNPTFQERFVYTVTEGLKELNVIVWNSNTLKSDDFIGSGTVQLAKALSHGFDDSTWPLQTGRGRHAGEVRLTLQYCIFDETAKKHIPIVPPQPPVQYAAPPPSVPSAPPPQPSQYAAPPPSFPYATPPQPSVQYAAPAPSAAYTPQAPGFTYPPATGGYMYTPSHPYSSSYTHNSGAYGHPAYYPDHVEPYPLNSPYPQPYGSYHPPCSCYQGAPPPPHRSH